MSEIIEVKKESKVKKFWKENKGNILKGTLIALTVFGGGVLTGMALTKQSEEEGLLLEDSSNDSEIELLEPAEDYNTSTETYE